MSNTVRLPSASLGTLSADDLLKTAPPADFDLADISPSSESLQSETITTPKASLSRPAMPSPFMPRTIPQHDKPTPLKNSSNLLRSTTLPIFSSHSTASPRGLMKPPAIRNTPSMNTTSSTGSVAKNKGVQMVSEMRARVKNLEQKIHTRVPRLRMVSITGRQNFVPSNVGSPVTGRSSASSATSNTSTAKTSWESQRKSIDSRRSNDSGSETHSKKKDRDDSSGWVLIMEDSPSPQKDKETKRLKEKRRLSIPIAPTSFRPSASAANRATSPSLSTGPVNSLAISTGLRRPQSRLSGGGTSSASTTSRPQTPTLLPVPSGSFYTPSTSAVGMKRSTGPGAPNPYNQQRSSLGGKNGAVPVPPLPVGVRDRPMSYTSSQSGSSSPSELKDLPALPMAENLHANVTVRPSSRMPSSTTTTSILSKSRIGRPSGGGISGRRSGGGESHAVLDIKDLRPRSGSSSAAK